jgi:hypothetical protein
MSFDSTRIRLGEMIAAISALVLFVAMFLDWSTFSGTPRDRFVLTAGGKYPPTGSAWHAYANTSLLVLVLIIAALALPVVTATGQRPGFPLAGAVTILAVLVGAFIVYKLFGHRPGGNTFTQVGVGGYLALVAIIGIIVGAFLTAQEEGWRWEQSAAEGEASATGAAEGGPGGTAGESGASPTEAAGPAEASSERDAPPQEPN